MSGRYVVATTNSVAIANLIEPQVREDFPDSTQVGARPDGLIVITVDEVEFERWVATQ